MVAFEDGSKGFCYMLIFQMKILCIRCKVSFDNSSTYCEVDV